MTKQQKIQKYFNQRARLTIGAVLYRQQVERIIGGSLREDIGKRGDITARALIKKDKKTTARIVAKQSGIMAGAEEAIWLLKKNKIVAIAPSKDGEKIRKNETIMKLQGSARDILMYERTILNLLQRMSGIATQTRSIIGKIRSRCLLCPTRKTPWGVIDKKAVVIGGGGTHRLGLHDFILIKENHLALLENPLSADNLKNFWEIEVKNSREAEKMARLKPDAMLFDNMGPEKIKKIVEKLPHNIIFEASGGINGKTITKYSASGVDIVSMGAITNSVKALDIALYIDT